MKKSAFVSHVKNLLTASDFEKSKHKIVHINPMHQTAFETLLRCGYNVDLAFSTYIPLYEYVSMNPGSNYSDTVKIILAVNKGFEAGVKMSRIILGKDLDLCSLSFIETRLLKEISVCYPFEFKTIYALFSKTKSFDKTVELVELGQRTATPLLLLAEMDAN